MDYILLMTEIDGLTHLREDKSCLWFGKVPPGVNVIQQVPILRYFKNEEAPLFCFYDLVDTYDVGVGDFLENCNFTG